MLKPSAWVKFQTPSSFGPLNLGSHDAILPRFLALQKELQDLLKEVDGVDLNKVVIVSPFSRHVRYNLFSAFEIIRTHQLRHLRQAELVKSELFMER